MVIAEATMNTERTKTTFTNKKRCAVKFLQSRKGNNTYLRRRRTMTREMQHTSTATNIKKAAMRLKPCLPLCAATDNERKKPSHLSATLAREESLPKTLNPQSFSRLRWKTKGGSRMPQGYSSDTNIYQ